MDPHIQRALMLLEQNRHQLAEEQLRAALAGDPQRFQAHAYLALALIAQKRYDEATAAAQQAVRLAPDSPLGHHALASVMNSRERFPEAQAAAEEALRLDPYNVHLHGALSQILIHQKEWKPALAAAEGGLEIDPEDVDCANLRAIALVKLGRREEAGAAIDSALRRNPDNPISHANQGWTLLEKRDSKKALEHFREALRLDPSNDWARAGIVEALKARHFIYSIMLRYFLWMARLKPNVQWGVIVGVFLANLGLARVSEASPQLAPILLPVRVVLIAFMLLTWTSDSLFNLLLRLNRFGRHALSDDQRKASNWLLAVLIPALLSLAACVAFGFGGMFLAALIVFGFLTLPVSAAFRATGWKRRTLGRCAAALACVGIGSLALLLYAAFQPEPQNETLADIAVSGVTVYIWGLVAFVWGTNVILSMPDRK